MSFVFTRLILPLFIVLILACGMIAQHNSEQWRTLYENASELYDEGYYEESLQAATDSLAQGKGLLGVSAEYQSHSLNLMALALDELGQYDEAEAAYLRSLELKEHSGDRKSDPDFAIVLNNLANSYLEQERYEEALAPAREALKIWELAQIDSQRGRVLLTLVVAMNGLGNYQQASIYAAEAVIAFEADLPDEEESLAAALHFEGDAHYEMSRYAEAEPLLLRALHIYRRIDPAETTSLTGCLTDVYLAWDKTAEAVALQLESVAFLEQLERDPQMPASAEDGITYAHPDIWLSAALTRCGDFYTQIEQYEQALPHYRRCIELDKRIYGAEHYHVVSGLNALGIACEMAGHYTEAEQAYLSALALLEGWEEQDTEMLFVVLQNLRDTYEKSGNRQKMEQVKERMHGLTVAAEEALEAAPAAIPAS